MNFVGVLLSNIFKILKHWIWNMKNLERRIVIIFLGWSPLFWPYYHDVIYILLYRDTMVGANTDLTLSINKILTISIDNRKKKISFINSK